MFWDLSENWVMEWIVFYNYSLWPLSIDDAILQQIYSPLFLSHFLNSLFRESTCKLRRAEAGCNSSGSKQFSHQCSVQRVSPQCDAEHDGLSTASPTHLPQRTINSFTNTISPEHSCKINWVHDLNFFPIADEWCLPYSSPGKLPSHALHLLSGFTAQRGCSQEVSPPPARLVSSLCQVSQVKGISNNKKMQNIAIW